VLGAVVNDEASGKMIKKREAIEMQFLDFAWNME
jgi:hypothetical protein